MKLSKAALLALRGLTPDKKTKLGELIGVSEKSVYRYINDNDDNLTKAAALAFIREETGLNDDQILETEEEPIRESTQK